MMALAAGGPRGRERIESGAVTSVSPQPGQKRRLALNLSAAPQILVVL